MRQLKYSKQVGVLRKIGGAGRGRRDLFVSAPVKAGLQAGIIANFQGDNASHVSDVLVVIPANVEISTTMTDGPLAAYIALASVQYRKTLRLAHSSPVEFDRGKMVGAASWREHRSIISNWRKWDWSHLGWDERFVSHYKKMRRRVPTNPVQRQRALRKFRSKCRWLGFTELLPG
jgi:hypothetical protein